MLEPLISANGTEIFRGLLLEGMLGGRRWKRCICFRRP